METPLVKEMRAGRLREYAASLAVFLASMAILYAWHHQVTAPNSASPATSRTIS